MRRLHNIALLFLVTLACGKQLVDFPNAPPTVASSDPANAATNVPVTQAITATFSQAMDPATITLTTFTVAQGATAVGGAVTFNAPTNVATFTPAANLTAGTVYTCTVTTGAKNAAGIALAANFVWTFTTAGAAGANPPTVLSTIPAAAAVGVALNSKVSALFSTAMNSTTITSTTFTLSQGATPVGGAVGTVGATSTFTPTANLTANTLYTATIKAGVKDSGGNALAADHTWTFTTSAPPQVTSTNPANGATNLCIPFGIDAIFDKQLDPLTVIPANFTLTSPGPTPIRGSTSYDSQTETATFAPSSNLLGNTTYTATLTTGIKDAAGDALAANKVWTFTTNANPCMSPVNLRSLSTFVAVAGAGLTNSNSGGVTVLNGDVGLSPTATCLGDGSPCSAIDPTINGTLFANDPAGKAAAAKADLVSAYNDAAGRPPGIVEADLSGLVLAPGVYTSNSTMIMATSASLTLDGQGDPNAVWIFQIGSSLTVNQGAQVLLINGAKAANVFWAAAASSTLGGNVHFNGTVLAQSSNSVGLGSVVNGRLLCTTGQITLLSNTINLP